MIKNTKVTNPKSVAWDIINEDFWLYGEPRIRPNQQMILNYLSSINEGESCCIIGASSVDVILLALEKKLDVTVIDFSKEMCHSLEKRVGQNKCNIYLHDILEGVPNELEDKFAYIIADRLINRFTLEELSRFFKHLPFLAKDHAEFRTVVKMGLYELDKKIIQQQQNHSDSETVYNSDSNIIDFCKAEEYLREISPRNGEISQEKLIQWYLHRGAESRYNHDMFCKFVSGLNNYMKIISTMHVTDETKSIYYILKFLKGVI